MYYDYYLLVRRVYGKNYGNTEFLSLYQNLHNFQTPVQGVKKISLPKTKIFSESVHFSPYILWCTYYIWEIDNFIPPPIHVYGKH